MNKAKQTNYEKITEKNLRLVHDHFGEMLRNSDRLSLIGGKGFQSEDLLRMMPSSEKYAIDPKPEKFDHQITKKFKLDSSVLKNLIQRTHFKQTTDIGTT